MEVDGESEAIMYRDLKGSEGTLVIRVVLFTGAQLVILEPAPVGHGENRCIKGYTT